MLTIDLSPLYRSTIGFDRLAEVLEVAERNAGVDDAYPPYNIEKTGDDRYRISMAVAGFADEDLKVEMQGQSLVVSGRRHAEEEDGERRTYLHRGIARRAFRRRFQLADHVKVTSATLSNGLLSIELEQDLPEELRPRRIAIRSVESASLPGSSAKLIEGSATEAA